MKTSQRHKCGISALLRLRRLLRCGCVCRSWRGQNLQFRRRGAINIVTRVAAMSSTRTIRALDFNFNLKSLRPTGGDHLRSVRRSVSLPKERLNCPDGARFSRISFRLDEKARANIEENNQRFHLIISISHLISDMTFQEICV